MTDHWNRFHDCERKLVPYTGPTSGDTPGLCVACKIKRHHRSTGVRARAYKSKDHNRAYPTLTGTDSARFEKDIER